MKSLNFYGFNIYTGQYKGIQIEMCSNPHTVTEKREKKFENRG